MEDRQLDGYFEQIMSLVGEENSQRSNTKGELGWWLAFCPTLAKAEVELLTRYKKSKSLKREDFSTFKDYLSEIASIDREIMMLEMTVDELYQDWTPKGANHSEFKVGIVFRSNEGRWLCTDKGTRTVIAIHYTPRTPENMEGPPYFLSEHVFDEYDLEAIDILG
jgi:hypothetical protein